MKTVAPEIKGNVFSSDTSRSASFSPFLSNLHDLETWSIGRFKGQPPELRYLVDGLIPLGTAGTVFSAGGVGKSALILDLGIRVSIAQRFPTKWLDRFPILEGGTVAYLSAEEPEAELHRRTFHICQEIGKDVGKSGEEIQNLSGAKLLLINYSGNPSALFDANTTEPTDEYRRVQRTLEKLNKRAPLRLIVIDTRSRLSGIEGSGNAAVTKEVSWFEKLAVDFNATLILLHHTSKTTPANINNPTAACRGESAFLNSLRFGIHLGNDLKEIPMAERKDYMRLTVCKQNYGKKVEPFIIHRDGFKFTSTDIAPDDENNEEDEEEGERDIDLILDIIRKTPGMSQKDIVKEANSTAGISNRKCQDVLKRLAKDKLVKIQRAARGTKKYTLVEAE